jgi:hypothetical protein
MDLPYQSPIQAAIDGDWIEGRGLAWREPREDSGGSEVGGFDGEEDQPVAVVARDSPCVAVVASASPRVAVVARPVVLGGNWGLGIWGLGIWR